MSAAMQAIFLANILRVFTTIFTVTTIALPPVFGR